MNKSKVTNLESELKGQIGETQKELKRNFFEQEEKAKKGSAAADQKYDEQLRSQLGNTLSKINEMFTTQQQQITKIQSQVTTVNDSVKVMKQMEEQIDRIKSDQAKLTKNLYKSLKIEPADDN